MITSEGQFCYLDIRSKLDLKIVCLNILVIISLMIYGGWVFNRTKRIMPSQDFRNVFIRLLAWALVYIGTYIYGIVVFLIYDHNLPQIQNHLTLKSQIYSFLETAPTIIIQIILLNIPIDILYQTMKLLEDQGHMPEPGSISQYQTYKKYRFVRILFLGSWIGILISFGTPQLIQNLFQIKMAFLMFDCVICFIALVHSREYTREKAEILVAQEHDRQRLKKQMNYLLISCVLRFFFDFLFFNILPFADSKNRSACIFPTQHQYNAYNIVFSIGFLLVGTLGMHSLFIFTVINMYKISQNDEARVNI